VTPSAQKLTSAVRRPVERGVSYFLEDPFVSYAFVLRAPATEIVLMALSHRANSLCKVSKPISEIRGLAGIREGEIFFGGLYNHNT
jgi:hypothetical protein